MNLKKNPKVNPNPDEVMDPDSGGISDHFLTLHNDEINTFEFVINALMEICMHEKVQAEQCAYLTHQKGQCDIKKGNKNFLKAMRDQLIIRGLNVTIE